MTIELDLDTPLEARPSRRPRKFVVISSVLAFVLIAVAAVVAGRLQRPVVPPLGTVLIGTGIAVETDDSGGTQQILLMIPVKNFKYDGVTLSRVTVKAAVPVAGLRAIVVPTLQADRYHGSVSTWPRTTSVVVPGQGNATVLVAFVANCAAAPSYNEFISGLWVTATMGESHGEQDLSYWVVDAQDPNHSGEMICPQNQAHA